MLFRSLLLVVVLTFKLVAAQAQGLLLPSPLPGHGAEGLHRPVPTLPGGVVVAPPIPTVGAAAAYLPLRAPAQRFEQALPDNRLYYQQRSPVATSASLIGAVAGWLLSADPRVRAYQQSRQFTGRDDAFSTLRLVQPDYLLR